MRGLNLDHLAAFAAVVEFGSFRAAAERLNLSQPAVSLQIGQLERRLGLRLLERVGRRAAPTSAGEILLVHLRRIDEAVTTALEAVADHAEGVAGRVRIGTGASACIYLLPPVLRELRCRFPQIEIIVRTGNTVDVLRDLEANVVDVALATLPAHGRSFAAEALIADEIVVVSPLEASLRQPITPAGLAGVPLLLYESGGTTRRIIDEWFGRAGVAVKPVMELGSIEALKELIAAGLGCGLLPRLAVQHAEAHGLVARSLAPTLYRQIGLVMRRDKIPDRALREVVAGLRTLGRAC